MKYKVTYTKIGHADKTCQIAHDGIFNDFHVQCFKDDVEIDNKKNTNYFVVVEIIVKVYVYSQNDSE